VHFGKLEHSENATLPGDLSSRYSAAEGQTESRHSNGNDAFMQLHIQLPLNLQSFS
jgi:hypothetical protein